MTIKIYEHTEHDAVKSGMHYDDNHHCPECGCPWYGNKDHIGIGYRMCYDCHQEWWIDVKYDHSVNRRELPK